MLTLAELGCTAALFANWIRYENDVGSNDNKSKLLARVGPTIADVLTVNMFSTAKNS